MSRARARLRGGRSPPRRCSPRSNPAAVWTGDRIIVVGGENLDASQGPEDRRFRAGYSYDPRTKTTTWLVAESFSDAAAYDPAADRWERLPRSPLAAHGSAAFWTGRELLVWGGWGERDDQIVDGVAYDPARRSWRRLAPWRAAQGLAWSAVWTGRELLVWGGYDHQPDRSPAGAAYDPRLDRWRPLAPFPLESRQWHAAVWTGREMLVWGGDDLVQPAFADGAAYDPKAGQLARARSVPARRSLLASRSLVGARDAGVGREERPGRTRGRSRLQPGHGHLAHAS